MGKSPLVLWFIEVGEVDVGGAGGGWGPGRGGGVW